MNTWLTFTSALPTKLAQFPVGANTLAQGEVEVFHGGASLLAPQATSGKVRLIAVTEIVAYHGVPILDAEGALFGSLCHFDVVEQPLSDDEFGDLQAFARALAQYVIGREPSGLPL